MIHVELPYDYGTFVKVKNNNGIVTCRGTVSAYMVVEDGYIVLVSRYNQPWETECLPEQVEPMTELEIEELASEIEIEELIKELEK